MNPSTPQPDPKKREGFDSLECEIIISDEPGGNDVVRPPTPEILAYYAVRREYLRKLGFNLDGTPIHPPDQPGNK